MSTKRQDLHRTFPKRISSVPKGVFGALKREEGVRQSKDHPESVEGAYNDEAAKPAPSFVEIKGKHKDASLFRRQTRARDARGDTSSHDVLLLIEFALNGVPYFYWSHIIRLKVATAKRSTRRGTFKGFRIKIKVKILPKKAHFRNSPYYHYFTVNIYVFLKHHL